MEIHNHGSVYGTIATIVLLFISRYTLSDWAAVAAIFAGFTTGLYNLHKFLKERKNKK